MKFSNVFTLGLAGLAAKANAGTPSVPYASGLAIESITQPVPPSPTGVNLAGPSFNVTTTTGNITIETDYAGNQFKPIGNNTYVCTEGTFGLNNITAAIPPYACDPGVQTPTTPPITVCAAQGAGNAVYWNSTSEKVTVFSGDGIRDTASCYDEDCYELTPTSTGTPSTTFPSHTPTAPTNATFPSHTPRAAAPDVFPFSGSADK